MKDLKITISFNTEDIPFPTVSMNISPEDIRYLASLYEHSPYVRNFWVEDRQRRKLSPEEFNFICPFSKVEEWYTGSKWTW